MLQQEFAPLESFGQLLADGLFDHPRTRKSNKRAGFRDIQIAQHGKARGDTTCRRVCKDADVWYPCLVKAHQSRADLRQLHQTDGAFLHPGAAEAEMMIKGALSAIARSIARVIFSPTTDPILPPMNLNSSAQM